MKLTDYQYETLGNILSLYGGSISVIQIEFPKMEEIIRRENRELKDESFRIGFSSYKNESQFVDLWMGWWREYGNPDLF